MTVTDTKEERERHARTCAMRALLSYHWYVALSRYERTEKMRTMFHDLAQVSKDEFAFWGTKGAVREDEVPPVYLFLVYVYRTIFGPIRVARRILRFKHAYIAKLKNECPHCLTHDELHTSHILNERSLALLSDYETKRTA
jgi:hypothetical protein